MARLPQPGSDHGTWGDVLNDFLSQALATNGQLKPDSVGTSQLKDNAVTASTIAPNSITTAALASNAVTAAIIADGTITETLLDSALQAKVNATAPVSSVAGKTGAVALSKSDVGLSNVDNTSDAEKNSATATLTNKTLDTTNTIDVYEDRFTLVDSADPTKRAQFAVSSAQPSGTTRILTLPGSSNQTLVGLSLVQTLVNKTISGTNNTMSNTFTLTTTGTSGSATYDGTTLNIPQYGTGDVGGPTNATDNAVARFDGTTGKLVKGSGVSISNSNEIGVGKAPVSGYALSANNPIEIVTTQPHGYETTVYGNAGQNVFKRANGSTVSPSAVLNGDSLGAFSFRGYTGSGFSASKAYIYAMASQDWTDSANGTNVTIQTTPNNSTTLQTAAIFTAAGQVRLPVAGSSAGLLIGGDANLYRFATDVLRTDDTFVADSIGIGGTPGQGTPLHVFRSGITYPAGTTNLVNVNISGTGDAGGTSDVRGLSFNVTSVGANSMNLVGITGDTYNANASGTIGAQTAASISVRVSGAANTGNGYGYRIVPILSSTGNLNTYRAFESRTPMISGTGVIGSAYGLYLDTMKQAGVTTAYGVYQAGSGDNNYFAAPIGVGTSAPTHPLTVSSTASGNGVVLYNTSDQTTNYERARHYWSGNVYTIGTEFGGTGVARNMELKANGVAFRIRAGGSPAGLWEFASGLTSANNVGVNVSGSYTAGSGVNPVMAIQPTINQTATAGYTALLVNPTETTTGSGTKLLADFQVGGLSKVKIDTSGVITAVAGTTAGSVATIDGAQTLTGKTISFTNNTVTGSPYDVLGFVQTLATRAVGAGDNTIGIKLARACTFTSVTFRCVTADASGNLVVELRKNGAQVSGTSTTIAAANQVAGGTTTGSWSFAAGDILTVHVTAVGTTPGRGLVADIVGVTA